jgi:hypothetical protein
MAEQNRNPQQQPQDQQRQAPGQQQQQGQPKQNEQGRNPGGQANPQDENVRRGDR